jgi:single-stranded DNA-specific DHH superfamily exonuclease
MEPFGPSNRRPVFKSSPVKVWHVKILKEAHLKLTVGQEDQLFEAIGFGMAAKWREMFLEGEVIPGKELFEIAFQPIFNTWNEKTHINLRLKDIKFAHV